MKYNQNFFKLEKNYIFSELKEQKNALISKGCQIIDLGIGDVKLPVFPLVANAMKRHRKI